MVRVRVSVKGNVCVCVCVCVSYLNVKFVVLRSSSQR